MGWGGGCFLGRNKECIPKLGGNHCQKSLRLKGTQVWADMKRDRPVQGGGVPDKLFGKAVGCEDSKKQNQREGLGFRLMFY